MQNFYKSILVLIIVGVFSMFVRSYLKQKEIRENQEQTVCKFVFCKDFPKTTKSFFQYKIKNEWFREGYGRCPDNYEKKINKFFRLYYSSKDSNKIIVDFSQEIVDTTEILNAGFSLNELE
ncbi:MULTISPECIES: hypothetical protein [Flavobacterium]|uniref:hypothetical protein n=1 Tax=Flavobacterium TaxID=237 RepID=UPI002114FA43|nr:MULTISPECIES: hypothetical protein [Flavobacterium]UUF12937.1 hypothetical protein NLJ00_16890 [Flavobacterium panici]